MHKSAKFALIDLGSSTVKLNVYEYETKNVFHKDVRTVNMAENFYPKLLITEEAMERVLAVLKRYKKYLEGEKIENIKLVTTGIARKAKNSDLLVKKIKEILNWNLEIISGEKEAELFYLGVTNDFSPDLRLAAINVGGGSTEVTIGTRDSINKRYSFPIGVSKLNEQFLQVDPPTDAMIEEMFSAINEVMEFEDNNEYTPDVLIHTGGELDYMEITKHPLEESFLSPSHPKQITKSKFLEKYNEIKKMPKSRLYEFMPQNPKWMDGAVACTAIALAIADKLGVNLIVPSNKNLNDGLLLKYAEEEISL
ncbi:MAG: Exopolyphosphatase [Candidatus Wolfebacteria bacterium GW2011_GWB1_41_12]|uniref:Exopolyphosphatase n=1 Tax=Candidatus Wolfebacteria bacterium GW2011_GWB1_41_12 TaxID=1619006 RepID=A0A0G0WV04_9BACT|nr:MAG: Exopolyphosphatase [Candidatus Wolfebacteria bacterium GW2011_GWB1_41_12]